MNVAISLMHRLRVSQPLISDLVERSRGRSRLWFWRQALGAIALTATRAIIERPTDALRSAAVSAGTMFVAYETMLRLYLWVSRGPFIDEFPRHSRAFLYAWHIYALPLNALWCLAAVLSGWLAVRMVAHRATFTLVVVAVQLPLVLWWGLPIAVGSVRNDLPINFALGWVFDATVILVAMPLCTLVGALL